jgi:hypothetical protein
MLNVNNLSIFLFINPALFQSLENLSFECSGGSQVHCIWNCVASGGQTDQHSGSVRMLREHLTPRELNMPAIRNN